MCCVLITQVSDKGCVLDRMDITYTLLRRQSTWAIIQGIIWLILKQDPQYFYRVKLGKPDQFLQNCDIQSDIKPLDVNQKLRILIAFRFTQRSGLPIATWSYMLEILDYCWCTLISETGNGNVKYMAFMTFIRSLATFYNILKRHVKSAMMTGHVNTCHVISIYNTWQHAHDNYMATSHSNVQLTIYQIEGDKYYMLSYHIFYMLSDWPLTMGAGDLTFWA